MENFKNPFKKNNETTKENENIKEELKEEVAEEETLNAEEETQDEALSTEEETIQKEAQETINEFEEKYNKLNDNYIRLAADFENFRKRTQNEKEELTNFVKIQVLKQIIVAVDTFEMARDHLKDIEDCQKIKESYDQAFKKFQETLTKIGLTEMNALGQPFNPNEHEAITQVPTQEYEPDTVAYVAQKGYKLEDKVVRPALVGVAKEQ